MQLPGSQQLQSMSRTVGNLDTNPNIVLKNMPDAFTTMCFFLFKLHQSNDFRNDIVLYVLQIDTNVCTPFNIFILLFTNLVHRTGT